MPHFIVRCDKTQRIWAISLPEKGAPPYNVIWSTGVMREAGWTKMGLFSDNENAMKVLKRKANEEAKSVECGLHDSLEHRA